MVDGNENGNDQQSMIADKEIDDWRMIIVTQWEWDWQSMITVEEIDGKRMVDYIRMEIDDKWTVGMVDDDKEMEMTMIAIKEIDDER